eukprot:4607049-Pleurochrysis_carterae.AAC.1
MKHTLGNHAASPPGRLTRPFTIEFQHGARHHLSARNLPSPFLRKSIGRLSPLKNASASFYTMRQRAATLNA